MRMVIRPIKRIMEGANSFGYTLSGASGGGYLILVANKAIENTIRIKFRRKDSLKALNSILIKNTLFWSK